MKLFFLFLKKSAGILTDLKDDIMLMDQKELTADLMPDTLSALQALMIAQAQESIYLKAVKGGY